MKTVLNIAAIIFALLGICLLLSGCTLTIGVKWGYDKTETVRIETKDGKK